MLNWIIELLFGVKNKEFSNKTTINQNNVKKHNYRKLKKEWIEKGKEYEKFIGNLYEKDGYIVKFNGIEKGKKDNSIDLIAIKGNEIVLIQCKNWKENSKYKITHKEIKAFIGDSYFFLEKNPQYSNYKIKRHFVVSNRILDNSAVQYIKENRDKIEYRLIRFEK